MDEKTVSIRHGKAVDIDYLINLLGELFEIEEDFTFDPAKHRKGLEMIIRQPDSSCLFIAEHIANKTILGMCTAQRLISTAEGGFSAVIEDLVVTRQFRNKGIGKALLNVVLNWSRAGGMKRCQLLWDNKNISASKFYHTQGFTTTRLVCLKKML